MVSVQLLLVKIWDRCVSVVWWILAELLQEKSCYTKAGGSFSLVFAFKFWLKLTSSTTFIKLFWSFAPVWGEFFPLFLLDTTKLIWGCPFYYMSQGFALSRKFLPLTMYLGVMQSGETLPQSDKDGDFATCSLVVYFKELLLRRVFDPDIFRLKFVLTP